MSFKHVLVPTDFSEPANHALSYAVEEAALHGASVTLLHVQSSDALTDVYYVAGAPASGLEAGFDIVEETDHIGLSQSLLKCKKRK
jgi:nucleotide-binding universal stress UspA family protein